MCKSLCTRVCIMCMLAEMCVCPYSGLDAPFSLQECPGHLREAGCQGEAEFLGPRVMQKLGQSHKTNLCHNQD